MSLKNLTFLALISPLALAQLPHPVSSRPYSPVFPPSRARARAGGGKEWGANKLSKIRTKEIGYPTLLFLMSINGRSRTSVTSTAKQEEGGRQEKIHENLREAQREVGDVYPPTQIPFSMDSFTMIWKSPKKSRVWVLKTKIPKTSQLISKIARSRIKLRTWQHSVSPSPSLVPRLFVCLCAYNKTVLLETHT